MQDKGFLTAAGRVVWQHDHHEVIARLGYRETRYNLRRVIVAREWIATLTDGAGESLKGRQYGGDTRREVIEQALAAVAALENGAP